MQATAESHGGLDCRQVARDEKRTTHTGIDPGTRGTLVQVTRHTTGVEATQRLIDIRVVQVAKLPTVHVTQGTGGSANFADQRTLGNGCCSSGRDCEMGAPSRAPFRGSVSVLPLVDPGLDDFRECGPGAIEP